jgi:DNA-binding transcriptional LysR family regulator
MILGSDVASVANQNIEQGVQPFSEGLTLENLDNAGWDDLRVFRTVASTKSFREAARALSVSVNTVRAGILRLEAVLDSALFARSYDGIKLTEDGHSVLDITTEMQTVGARLRAGTGNNTVVRHREIRICCSEGIGEFWLTPRLTALQERLPRHGVSLHSDFNQSKIHSSEYDLCLGFLRPESSDTIVSKLASLHFMMYASDAYVARYGEPKSLNEATQHRFVLHDAPGTPDFASMFVGIATSNEIICARVNTSYSLLQAISNGVGIGALPTYVRTQTTNVRPLDLPIQLKFDLWLSFNPSAKASIPVRTAIDWLHECFDSKKYPWFGNDFVHPDAFESLCASGGNSANVPQNHPSDASL